MSTTIQSYPIADYSRLNNSNAKLLVIEENYQISHHFLIDLYSFLKKGDLLIVNNTGTLPASFRGVHQRTGNPIELRLAYSMSSDPKNLSHWTAIVFGDGNWKIPTEHRKSPPPLTVGDHLVFKHDLIAEIIDFSPDTNRFVEIKFKGTYSDLWLKIYQAGKPIQYSYLKEDLYLWDQQTIFAGPPVSVESPSASFQLTWDLIFKLQEKGVEIASITHAISLSSIGDEDQDKQLPLPERYWISQQTADMINSAKFKNRRIIAIGTSVTRALESNALLHDGQIQPGSYQTTLRITEDFPLFVDGLLTGLHMTGESHIELLTSFIPKDKLELAYHQAIKQNYLWHEYGDLSLILLSE